jgi:DNA-binding transcriptional MerR regulator
MNDVTDQTWRVGDLAKATGLTVRTLHHYDRIGLLLASRRDSLGHRRYTGDDVRRLHRVTALRGFGFSLAEIGQLLDGSGSDVRGLVRQQLDQAEDRIVRAQRLRMVLISVLRALDDASEPSAHTLIELIEVMNAVDHTYTPAELAELAEGRRRMMEQLSPEQLAEMAQRQRAAYEQLTPEQRAELQASRNGRRAPGGEELH